VTAIMSDWTQTTIGALGRVLTGRTPSSAKSKLFGSEYPFITPTDIQEGQHFVRTERFLSEGGLQSQSSLLLPPKAVCFVCIGATIGKICITDRPSFTNQQINSIIVDQREHDPRFVYHLLRFHAGRIKAQAGGAATPIVNKTAFSSVEVLVPELSVQQYIGAILSGYDDLIENNVRRIKLVKNIAQTVFQAARTRSSKDWELVPISNLYAGLYDGPHATPKPSESGPIFLGIGNVTERGELDLSGIRHIAEQDFAMWTRRVLPVPGDIVFTYEATLHRYAMIREGFRGCLGRRLALIRPDAERVDPYFLLYSMLDDEWRREVTSKIISGATVDRVPLISFPRFQIRVPTLAVQREIGASIRACEELADNCSRRNRILRATRDFLLPKLISGQIKVEEAEREAVAQGV
jgi:type I restriction enzyme S subunit